MLYKQRGRWRMTSTERIVAMSLATGGAIAIINSTVWAIAACFMSYQRARVRVAQAQAMAYGYERLSAEPEAQLQVEEPITEG